MRIPLALLFVVACSGPAELSPRTATPNLKRPAPDAPASLEPSPDAVLQCSGVKVTAADEARMKNDFDDAEKFFTDNYIPYRIAVAPKTGAEMREVLAKLSTIADTTKKMYRSVGDSGQWGVAAKVRLGDIEYFQIAKLSEVLPETAVYYPPERYPARDVYNDINRSTFERQREQAISQWSKAVATARTQCLENVWTKRALARIAGGAVNEPPAPTDCQQVDIANTALQVNKTDFDTAETFYKQGFALYEVKRVPQRSGEAQKYVNEINKLASAARWRYGRLAFYRTGPWAVAALLRAGDVSNRQAELILDIQYQSPSGTETSQRPLTRPSPDFARGWQSEQNNSES